MKNQDTLLLLGGAVVVGFILVKAYNAKLQTAALNNPQNYAPGSAFAPPAMNNYNPGIVNNQTSNPQNVSTGFPVFTGAPLVFDQIQNF